MTKYFNVFIVENFRKLDQVKSRLSVVTILIGGNPTQSLTGSKVVVCRLSCGFNFTLNHNFTQSFFNFFKFCVICFCFCFVFSIAIRSAALPDFSVKSTKNSQLLEIDFSKIANFSGFS